MAGPSDAGAGVAGKRARAVEFRDAGRISAEQATWLEASDALLERVRGLVFAKAENPA